MLKKRKYQLIFAGVLVVLVLAFVFIKTVGKSGQTYKVKKGNLEVVVNCKGEIKGEKYTEINLPPEVCNQELRVYTIKITDLVLEGKTVKKGDYIAKLDESQFVNMMRDNMQQKEKVDADLRNAILDSTVTLSAKREAVNNAKLDLEYLKIDLDQSKYESEAYQRKIKMNYQKAENEVGKLQRDYLLERNRLKIQVARSEAQASQFQKQIEKYQKALAATIIRAPDNGIIMFAKDWSGKTYGKDSELNIWNTLLATLPDMTNVISEAYIREIDIAKVMFNDSVRIKIDALSDKVFWGKVVKIATIGEDHKDFDMKAFKVIIKLDKSDLNMKPGMTANNEIIIASYRDRLLVPIKAVFPKNGKQVVYLKKGTGVTEQEVKLVAENEEFGVVEQGVSEGDVILLYQPEKYRQKGKN